MARNDISKLIRKEIEASDAELRSTIGSITEEELVAWARTQILGNIDMLKKGRIDPAQVIEAGASLADEAAIVELAETYGEWSKALVNTVRKRRQAGEVIPQTWHDFVFDTLLGIRKKPDGRGKTSKFLRNEAICACIRQIATHTSLKATRSEASYETQCAVSIVSAALNGNPGYEGVERVWHEYLNRRAVSK